MQATDLSPTDLDQLRHQAKTVGMSGQVITAVHDVRTPLSLPDASVDADFARMLLCMVLSTQEFHAPVGEIRRAASRPSRGKPGGQLHRVVPVITDEKMMGP
ncbi:hypothetical protein SAMN05421806_1333 [Streptomyces indicus]|uniref:Methyltransferase domain-containing protein n=2 Tax=Streptomyces indicus TaxID=417292 RepID=A0A1G9JM43_9ACTN|nr:hypothetical protein SAMN05421806_1333 [Streptomyces indicus]